MEFDALDRIAADAFDGYIVRKDLVRKFARQYPVPTYVCEFQGPDVLIQLFHTKASERDRIAVACKANMPFSMVKSLGCGLDLAAVELVDIDVQNFGPI